MSYYGYTLTQYHHTWIYCLTYPIHTCYYKMGERAVDCAAPFYVRASLAVDGLSSCEYMLKIES
jgi:hypothetical protein